MQRWGTEKADHGFGCRTAHPCVDKFAVHLGRVDCAEDRPVENRTNALCPGSRFKMARTAEESRTTSFDTSAGLSRVLLHGLPLPICLYLFAPGFGSSLGNQFIGQQPLRPTSSTSSS